MISPHLDPTFRDGLRARLVEHARTTGARKRSRLLLVGAISLGLLAAGGTAAAAGGLLPLPGGVGVTELGQSVTVEGSGTQTLTLGPAPEGATTVRIQIRCLTAGSITLPAATGSMTCTSDDAGTPRGGTWVDIELDRNMNPVTITAASDMRWEATTRFLATEQIPVAVNDKGDTYGIDQAPGGRPDLIAVVATNGQQGYVYSEELDEIDGTNAVKTFRSPEDALAWQAEREGKTFSLPVYESDGVTVIGEFVLG